MPRATLILLLCFINAIAFAGNPCGISCINRLIKQQQPTPCIEGDLRCGVFVTQMHVQGDMSVLNPLNGFSSNLTNPVEKADAICQFEGQLTKPNSQWRAFLSTDNINAIDHAIQSNITYYSAGTDLKIGTSSSIFDANTDSNGSIYHLGTSIDGSDDHAWTGTAANGSVFEDMGGKRTCANWTDKTDGTHGRAGGRASIVDGWTSAANIECDWSLPLYCFQQPTVE